MLLWTSARRFRMDYKVYRRYLVQLVFKYVYLIRYYYFIQVRGQISSAFPRHKPIHNSITSRVRVYLQFSLSNSNHFQPILSRPSMRPDSFWCWWSTSCINLILFSLELNIWWYDGAIHNSWLWERKEKKGKENFFTALARLFPHCFRLSKVQTNRNGPVVLQMHQRPLA